MPHDRNGREVKEGDRVVVAGTVKSVQANHDFCNVTVVGEPYNPPHQMGFCVTLNTKETELSGLTFRQLARASAQRLLDFKDADGTPIHDNICGTEWSALEWAGAMCGEAGEAANLCKKLKRGDYTLDSTVEVKGVTMTVRQAIGKELADTVAYAEALARRCGIDLGEAVREKFNEVSEKIKSKVTL